MSPTTLRAVFEALAAGLLPLEPLQAAVEAIAAGRDFTEPLEVAAAALEATAAPESSTPFDLEAELGRDELDHLFEALALCADDRGACLLLCAALAADWGVDPELLVGADVEGVVDELRGAGSAEEAADRAVIAAEVFELE